MEQARFNASVVVARAQKRQIVHANNAVSRMVDHERSRYVLVFLCYSNTFELNKAAVDPVFGIFDLPKDRSRPESNWLP